MKLIRKFPLTLALATALMGANVGNAVPITYTVNQTVGAGGVTGNIVTDGTFGTIGIPDIASWSLTLNNGTTTYDLTQANSYLFGSGQLGATSQQLTYDFSSGNYFAFILNGSTNINSTDWCLQSFFGQCFYGGGAGEGVQIQSSNLSPGPFKFLSGTQVIATASVPEPETYAMMLAGLGLIGFIAYRRKNDSSNMPMAA
jgi:PEP-CTERM motif